MKQINIWHPDSSFYLYEGKRHEYRFDSGKRKEFSSLQEIETYLSSLTQDEKSRHTRVLIDAPNDKKELEDLVKKYFSRCEVNGANFKKVR